MKIALIIAVAVLLSTALTRFVLASLEKKARDNRKKTQAKRAAPRERRKFHFEMTKLVIWVCLGNGIAWVWFSYYLAWKEKMQIAEGLSQVAVTEIIGVVLAYCIKSAVENLSKNNNWPDKGHKAEPPEDEGGKG